MRCCSTGSGLMTTILTVVGVAGIAAGGFALMSGKSVCSLFSCDTKTDAAITVANTESSDAKSCCALGGKAKAVTASATEKTCDKPCDSEVKAINASTTESTCNKAEAKAVNASATSTGCCKDKAAKAVNASAAEKSCDKPCDGEAKAINASATDAIECPHLRAQAAVASAKTEGACSASKTPALPAGMITFAFAASDAPVFTPVFRAECGAVSYDCSIKAINASNLEAAGGCSDKKAGDCSKPCDSAAKEVKAINASASELPACQAGKAECKNGKDGCKGDGQNGCCGGCADAIAREQASKDAIATPVKGS